MSPLHKSNPHKLSRLIILIYITGSGCYDLHVSFKTGIAHYTGFNMAKLSLFVLFVVENS